MQGLERNDDKGHLWHYHGSKQTKETWHIEGQCACGNERRRGCPQLDGRAQVLGQRLEEHKSYLVALGLWFLVFLWFYVVQF